MTTITLSVTAPDLKTITRGLSGDWGPTIHRTARSIGQVVALLWTLCSLASDRWQQLVAWAQAHQIHGLARLGLPGGTVVELPPNLPWGPPIYVSDEAFEELQQLAADHSRGATKMVTQRFAIAAATPANIAPPSAGIIHISDPMARAIRMVREGRSQRLAAHLCGVPRSSLQRALKA